MTSISQNFISSCIVQRQSGPLGRPTTTTKFPERLISIQQKKKKPLMLQPIGKISSLTWSGFDGRKDHMLRRLRLMVIPWSSPLPKGILQNTHGRCIQIQGFRSPIPSMMFDDTRYGYGARSHHGALSKFLVRYANLWHPKPNTGTRSSLTHPVGWMKVVTFKVSLTYQLRRWDVSQLLWYRFSHRSGRGYLQTA